MIWLIGYKGMLGTELARQFKQNNIPFIGTDIDVDITDEISLNNFISDKKFDWIINCAAYTAVDKAESDIEICTKLNVYAIKNIATIAKKTNAKLIHFSTDYVFDGTGSTPITEKEYKNPTSIYGKTKSDGEEEIFNSLTDFYLIRTAWLSGFHGKNFVYTMIRAMNTHDAVKVVCDQKGTPTFAATLAGVIISIINKAENGNAIPYGIYHCTDEGETTWFEFTKEIKRQAVELGLVTNKDCIVNSCTTEEYPTPAKRPAYSVLSKAKIQNALNIRLPQWQDSLSEFLTSGLFEKDRIK